MLDPAFRDCVNELAEAFRTRNMKLTRYQFKKIVDAHDQDREYVQAYMESAGMQVLRVNRQERDDADLMEWRLP